MINLLPDDTKKEIRAARMNVVLLRYNIFTLAALALLLVLCLGFYVVLHANQSNAVSTSSDNDAKAQSYASVRTQADDYRTNLTLAKSILDNEVNYTNVIFEITKLLPTGVVLDGITLNASDFGKQTSFTAHAKGYDEAAKLKANFQSSPLFQTVQGGKKQSNVFFQSLTDDSQGGSSSTGYPISINISTTLGKVTQ
jgi:hypothetical protein